MERSALSRSEGNEKMRLMAKSIQEGASAFLKEEAKRIAIIAILIAIFISVVFKIKYGVVMLVGAFVSEMAGLVGMYISTRTNVRKNTVGPSMDILIKLMAVLSLFFGSLFSTLPFFIK